MSTSMMERFVKKSYLVHLLAKVQKKKRKRTQPPNNSLYFEKRAFLLWYLKNYYISGNGNPKKFLIFSQKEAVLILQETETPIKFFIFCQKKAFLLFWETETLKKILIFQKMGLSNISFIFQEVTLWTYIFSEKSCSYISGNFLIFIELLRLTFSFS